MYLIANIVWSVQVAALKNYIDDELESSSVCLRNVACVSEPILNTESYLQLDISLVSWYSLLHCTLQWAISSGIWLAHYGHMGGHLVVFIQGHHLF